MAPNDSEENGDITVDEETPLLANSSARPDAVPEENKDALTQTASSATEDEDKPLPKTQIFLLSFTRLVDPVAYFSIFPFVNEMIYETGNIREEDVGFYSGLIESLFSITQMCVMLFWGRASDRIGRKPILVATLLGMAVTVSLFGFAKSVWQMILFRCLAGVFSGSIVCTRAMIQELTTPKTQARAFSYFAFVGNVGIFLGPVVGGGLSKLADHYPNTIFGKSWFLKEFPYALPTVFSGCLALVGAITTLLFVNETLDKGALKKHGKHGPMTTWQLLREPGVAYVLFIYGWVTLIALAFTAVAPVFWFTSPELGGFGFDERLISVFLGIGGASQAAWMLLAFPPLQHRIGTGGVMILCATAHPFFFALSPVGNWVLRNHWKTAFWSIGPPLLVIGSGVAMSFTAIQLLVNNISPSPATLGTLNAISLAIGSGTRAWAPAAFTSLFAVGVRNHILYGQLIWVVLVMIALVLTVAVHYLPKKAVGKVMHKRHDEEEPNGEARVENGQTTEEQRREA